MPSDPKTLLLKGGNVLDGTGAPAFEADVLVRGDAIAGVGEYGGAERMIDVRGLVVCPGFMDTHGHSEFTLLCDPRAEGKILQGITTEVNGNCGLSAAPLSGPAMAQREEDLRQLCIKQRWSGFGEYFGLLEEKGIALNFATLAGHGNIRASVMGYEARSPGPPEMAWMKRLLEESLRAGAIGMSTGLIYPPGVYAQTPELVELSAHGRGLFEGFVYASHMRSEGDMLLEALDEAIGIGHASGARVHVSHIKTSGRRNWRKAEEAISMIERARGSGLGVTCDRYPYTASSTDLDTVLPAWAFEGGRDEELERLENPATATRIKDEISKDMPEWAGISITSVSTENNQWMEGKSLLDVADRLGEAPLDALVRLLVEEKLMVGAAFHNMSEENLRRFIALPYVMVGTDSSARSLSGRTAKGKPHPRGFGSFPRYLKNYAVELPEAVRKITVLPALTFGIRGRGRIAEGLKADLVVFDPAAVGDGASFEEPFRPPSGIHYVMVNGTLVAEGGEPTGARPGRVLRGGGGCF